MDKNKIIIKPEEVQPQIAVANYFTVNPGTVWGPRTIPDYELILVVEGEFELELEQERLTIEPSEVLCIFPREHHTFRHLPTPGRRGVISCLHLELLPNRSRGRGDYYPEQEPHRKIACGGDPEIAFLFRKCARLFKAPHRHRTTLLRLAATEIWLRLTELWEHGPSGCVSNRTRAMRQFLEKNWNQPIGRRELAKAFDLTPEHVNSVFRREAGITPGQYLTGLRVHQACRMLMEEGMTVKETADACGFEDEFYFSRVFKKYTGRAPATVMSRKADPTGS